MSTTRQHNDVLNYGGLAEWQFHSIVTFKQLGSKYTLCLKKHVNFETV